MRSETGCPRHRADTARRRRTEGFDTLGLSSPERARHWVAAIGIAITAIGVGFSIYSQMQAASAQQAMFKYNQQVANQQAQQALMASAMQAKQAEAQAAMLAAAASQDAGFQEENAKLAREAAEYQKHVILNENTAAVNAAKVEEDNAKRALERVTASSRSLIAASGVETEGSPLMVIMEQAAETDLAISRIRYGTALREGATAADVRATEYSGELAARGHLIEATRTRRAGAMESEALLAEARRIRFTGELEAWGARTQGAMFGFQRRAARSALPWQIGSSLMAGAGSAWNIYSQSTRRGGYGG